MDGQGLPLSIVLTPGNVNLATAFGQVLDGIRIPRVDAGRPRTTPDRVLGDKAYSSRAIRRLLRRRGIAATIPERRDQEANRRRRGRLGGRPSAFDKQVYRDRNVVERCFARLKQFCAVGEVDSGRPAGVSTSGFPRSASRTGVPVSRKTSARSSACGAGSASPLDRPPAPVPGRPRCARRRAAHSPGQGHVRRWRVRPARPARPPTALLGHLVWIMPGRCPGARAAATASGRRFNPPGFRCGLRCVGAVRCRQGAGGRLPGRPRWRPGAGRPPRSRGRRRVRRRPPGHPRVS